MRVQALQASESYPPPSPNGTRHHGNATFLEERRFRILFKTVFEKELPKRLQSQIEEAEQVRDKIVHGKRVSAADKRKAVVDVVAYATGFNKFVEALTGARPFGDLRGFKGRAQGLEKSTTRWLLKGMGFEVA